MAKGNKKSKKAAQVTPLAGYEDVIFRNEDQKSKFVALIGKKLMPTRFIDRHLLDRMGILLMVDEMLTEAGVGSLRGMQEHTYPSLTYEFLSAYEYDRNAEMVTFRLLNEEVTMTETEFKECLGLVYDDDDADKRPPRNFTHEAVWGAVTGATRFNVSNLRVSHVEHPALRYYFRLVAGTFFGRAEPGKLNRTDLLLAGCALNVEMHEQWDLNFAHLILEHFQHIANLSLSTIHIGGIVTYIAKRRMDFTGEFHNNMTEIIPRLDEKYLTNHSQNWMEVLPTGEYKWKLGASRYIFLPSPTLPRITFSEFIEPGQRPSGFVKLTLPEEMVFTEGVPRGAPHTSGASVSFCPSPTIPASDPYSAGPSYTDPFTTGPAYTDQFFTSHTFSEPSTAGPFSDPFSGGPFSSGPTHSGPYSTGPSFAGPFDTQSSFAGAHSAGAFGTGGSTGAGCSEVPLRTPKVEPGWIPMPQDYRGNYIQPPFFPNSFTERRHAHEMVNQNLQGHMMHSYLLDQGYGNKDGPHPSYWQSKESYPGTVFDEYNVDPKEWGPDYGQIYGGLGGQWLPPQWPGTSAFGGQDARRGGIPSPRARRGDSSGPSRPHDVDDDDDDSMEP